MQRQGILQTANSLFCWILHASRCGSCPFYWFWKAGYDIAHKARKLLNGKRIGLRYLTCPILIYHLLPLPGKWNVNPSMAAYFRRSKRLHATPLNNIPRISRVRSALTKSGRCDMEETEGAILGYNQSHPVRIQSQFVLSNVEPCSVYREFLQYAAHRSGDVQIHD
jgi:hypothetical protein